MRQYLKDSAALPTRLILGFGFAFHGYGKLFSAEGHAGFVGMPGSSEPSSSSAASHSFSAPSSASSPSCRSA
jgi:uncharacterized membrane protein YphA (DoxX/SURF4 family)